MEGLPLDVEVLAKVPTASSKRLRSEPTIYHWCYALRAKVEENDVNDET
jgi:hypothetical protein